LLQCRLAPTPSIIVFILMQFEHLILHAEIKCEKKRKRIAVS
jgi:hypothetical protein